MAELSVSPAGGAGAVSSVFTRTGAVVAAANDYTYAQVGAAANAVAITNLAAGLAGQVIQGATPSYAYPPGFEIAYDQITVSVAVVSTSEGAPTAIIAGTSHTYESVPYLFHFFAPAATLPSTTAGLLDVLLMEDAASIGRISTNNNDITGGQSIYSLVGELRFTPTAGAHTFGISAFAGSTTGAPAIQAGAGGSGVIAPAFLRVTKC